MYATEGKGDPEQVSVVESFQAEWPKIRRNRNPMAIRSSVGISSFGMSIEPNSIEHISSELYTDTAEADVIQLHAASEWVPLSSNIGATEKQEQLSRIGRKLGELLGLCAVGCVREGASTMSKAR